MHALLPILVVFVLVSELLSTVIAGEPDPSVERSGFVKKASIKSMLTP